MAPRVVTASRSGGEQRQGKDDDMAEDVAAPLAGKVLSIAVAVGESRGRA